MKNIPRRLAALLSLIGIASTAQAAFSFSAGSAGGTLYWMYDRTEYDANHNVIGTGYGGSGDADIDPYGYIYVPDRGGNNPDGSYWVDVSVEQEFWDWC